MPTKNTGPSFQRRTKPSKGQMTSANGSGTTAGKAKQYSGRDMAKKYMQKTQKSSSARITGTTWGNKAPPGF